MNVHYTPLYVVTTASLMYTIEWGFDTIYNGCFIAQIHRSGRVEVSNKTGKQLWASGRA